MEIFKNEILNARVCGGLPYLTLVQRQSTRLEVPSLDVACPSLSEDTVLSLSKTF